MSLSTLRAASSTTTGPDVLTEDAEPAGFKTSCPKIVLSSQAKERLKLLNRALANCVPQSLGAQHQVPGESQWE